MTSVGEFWCGLGFALAALAPTGMIFVPSAGGRSHCPEEHTDWHDVEDGANVLLDTVITLADG